MRLKGKVAIITGGGSGYGAAIARHFAREGARVACVDLNGDNAAKIASELGREAIGISCDVADGASVAAMVQAVMARFGDIEVIINNAGITQQPKRLAKSTEAEIDRLFAVNLKSLYHMAVHAFPVLRKRGGGCVINTASVTAIRPRPGMTWYNASKAAVISVTHSMAAELAPDRIRVNAIAPGVGRTPMFEEMFPTGADEAYERLAESFPLGRLCQPDDVAGAAVYLASDDACFVTGIVLPVDGGRLVG